MTDTTKTAEQIAAELDAKKADQAKARAAKKAAWDAMSPAEKAQAKIDKANAAIAKAQADLEKTAKAEANKEFANLFNAWADAKGHSNEKGNRRASNMALIAEWEADVESGFIESLKVGAE